MNTVERYIVINFHRLNRGNTFWLLLLIFMTTHNRSLRSFFYRRALSFYWPVLRICFVGCQSFTPSTFCRSIISKVLLAWSCENVQTTHEIQIVQLSVSFIVKSRPLTVNLEINRKPSHNKFGLSNEIFNRRHVHLCNVWNMHSRRVHITVLYTWPCYVIQTYDIIAFLLQCEGHLHTEKQPIII